MFQEFEIELLFFFLFFPWYVITFQDIIITVLVGVGYFCGAVPMGVHATDWKFWRGQGSDEDVEIYNINNIVSSIEATAVSDGGGHGVLCD